MHQRGPISGKVVLVTGASGFIGSHLARRLASDGNEVHGISRQNRTTRGVRWLKADLSLRDETDKAIRDIRPEIVFHLAGEAHGSLEREELFTTLSGNLISTVNVLNACCDAGVKRVVCAGSMEEPTCVEATPTTPYAASKSACLAYERLFDRYYGLSVINTRIFMTYGPGDLHFSRVIPYSILCFLRGEAPLLTSGERKIDWIYIADVVEGLIASAAAQEVRGRSVDIGTGTMLSLRELVEQIAELTGAPVKPQFGAIRDRVGAVQKPADAVETQRMLGWSAKITLKEGLQQTIESYREQLVSAASADQ